MADAILLPPLSIRAFSPKCEPFPKGILVSMGCWCSGSIMNLLFPSVYYLMMMVTFPFMMIYILLLERSPYLKITCPGWNYSILTCMNISKRTSGYTSARNCRKNAKSLKYAISSSASTGFRSSFLSMSRMS